MTMQSEASRISPERDQLEKAFRTACQRGLSLDLTRGKPSSRQLDLAAGLDGALRGDYTAADGTDVRNYGGLYGIAEARQLGADLLGAEPTEVLCGGNSSLTLMFQYAQLGHLYGYTDPDSAWQREAARRGQPVRFLCPVPGYDRHFGVCEQLGIEMLTVPMLSEGPDIAQIESRVQTDPMIKGVWCIPRYSNPTGVTFSDQCVRRFAALPAIAGDHFRVFWDNAYAEHHFTELPDPLLDILPIARDQGTASGIAMFASTAKISFAGAGISFLASSPENLARFTEFLGTMTIGHDKVNQLRHVRFFADADGLRAHMRKHAQQLAPKFAQVQSILERDLGNLGIAHWTQPRGGYFVSLDTQPGQASKVIAMAAQAGVKLTPAGATFPYGLDPQDSNIRIAPTFADDADLSEAMQVVTLCIRLAAARAADAESSPQS